MYLFIKFKFLFLKYLLSDRPAADSEFGYYDQFILLKSPLD